MIEPTDQMVTAAAEVAEDEMIRRLGRDLGTIHRDDIVRAILTAGLAVAERDYCLERRGHVWHPLAREREDPEWSCPICGYYNRGSVCTHCGAMR